MLKTTTKGISEKSSLFKQDNMRVLFLSTGYPHNEDPMSGIFVKTQAEALVRQGVEVEVVAPVPWVPPGFQWLLPKWQQYRDTPVYYELSDVRVHRPRYLQLPKADIWAHPHVGYRRVIDTCITQSPDVIHAHFAYPPGLAAVQWSKKNGLPYILTLHGDDVNTAPYRNFICRKRFVETCIEADGLLAVSSALADHTYRLTGIMPQVSMIGVNRRPFYSLPKKADARKILQLPSTRPLVVYVGSLLPAKGIRELLEALTVLADDEILGIMVGDGPLRAQAARHPSVRTVGLCDQPTVLLYMRAADVLVLPSYSEGMPTVLLEAGWVGVPVVASTVGGIPQLLGEERGLLIDAKNPYQIVRGIRDVLMNPELAHERSERLFHHVQENYDADTNARLLIEIYRQAIAHTSNTAEVIPDEETKTMISGGLECAE